MVPAAPGWKKRQGSEALVLVDPVSAESRPV